VRDIAMMLELLGSL